MFPARRVHISGGFFLLAAWFAVANGLPPLAMVLLASAVHELGHCLALWTMGASVLGLRIEALGAVLETDSGQLSYREELAALLAGPAANLLCASTLAAWDSRRWNALIGANLVLGAFNLLPIRPLDGGRAFYLLISWIAGPQAGEWAVRCIGVSVAAALVMGLVYLMCRTGGSLWLLPAAGGLLAAAGREFQ